MRTGPGVKPVDGRNTTGPQTDELSREQEAVYFQVGLGGRGPCSSESSHKQEICMGLHKEYPEWFRQIWDAYPKFPEGRSRKAESFEIAKRLRKRDNWTDLDVKNLVQIINHWKITATHWQPSSEYGPPGLQTFLHKEKYRDPPQIRHKPQRPLDRWDRANIEFENRLRAVK